MVGKLALDDLKQANRYQVLEISRQYFLLPTNCAEKSRWVPLIWKFQNIRPCPSSPGPLFQDEGRCSAFDMEIIFHSHANKTHFHKG